MLQINSRPVYRCRCFPRHRCYRSDAGHFIREYGSGWCEGRFTSGRADPGLNGGQMKSLYILPNLVTTGNLFCGFYSLVLTMDGHFVRAAWMIVFASVFDLLDGRVARLAKAESSFGVQYDSLCDLVSFGVAPAILMYQWAFTGYGRLGWLVAFFFTACGAFRLARFNVTAEESPKDEFSGLPIPMASGIVTTFVLFTLENDQIPHDLRPVISLVLIIGMALLMVLTVRFPSFKEINWKSRAAFPYFLLVFGLLVLILIRPEVTLFFGLLTYVILGLLTSLLKILRGNAKGSPV